MDQDRTTSSTATSGHFIQRTIEEDLQSGRYGGRVHTRFPPEPNGYLHIGHAKSICLNFAMADQYGGLCNLRFDDTNPVKEEQAYIDAIVRDIRWLGFDWGDRLYYASDYFEQLYRLAVQLVEAGLAYVDSQSADEIRAQRGTLTEPGRESPFRRRTAAENLDLLERMRAGEFPDGAHVLRARIDMSSGNINLRDPVMYRILRAHHHRTGDAWCIYPTYDWAHGQSDSIEGITHSLCTLEFEDHRPLYNWFVEQLGIHAPRQIEFARLNLSHTVVSKRKLIRLVREGHVEGWDDPRMPTLAGLRRRGYTPEAIRGFCERVGVAKKDNVVEIALLEHTLREDLNRRAPRTMAVLDPVELILEDYPADQVEGFDLPVNPEDPSSGMRSVPFSSRLLVERDDFTEEPPRNWFRLAPGREVRLKGAYYVTCVGVDRDPVTGAVQALRCTHDPASRGGSTPDGRTVRGTLHWISAAHSAPARARLYEHLFVAPQPDDVEEGADFLHHLNPDSVQVLDGCRVEAALAGAAPGSHYQFLRHGYYVVDDDSTPERPVFNRAVGLRDSWSRARAAGS